MQLPIAFIACILTLLTARAETSTIHSNVRALGMGDAFTSLANDESSLFYNPAGLANVSGINLKLFSVRAGAGGLDALKKIKDLQSSEDSEYADAVASLYGKNAWTGFGGEASFTAPLVGLMVFNHADALVRINNPVNPEMTANVVNDFGYALGVGLPVTPFLQVGMDLKQIKRTGSRLPLGATFVADLDSDALKSRLTQWGRGYAADLGLNIFVPTPLVSANLAAVWRNVGRTTFHSESPGVELPYDDNDVTVGASLVFDTPLLTLRPAVDLRYLTRPDLQLTRKINFGIEIDLPLIDIRGGFREGYYTAGAGVDLGLFKVDVATYGVELGAYPGQIEDRRYVLEFAMELGIGNFTAANSPAAAKAAAGETGPASSRSIWGSGRLKQRR